MNPFDTTGPMRTSRLVLAAAIAFAAPAGLRAQERDTVTLAPIVVTATRLPSPASALASSVTVLDGEALRRAGVTTVADALRSVPGIALARAGSPGAQTSLFLRGGESDYVRLLLDGVPVNQAGGFLDLADLSTDNVERIEIVRGPASVLYGSEAVTGVVQVITRRGRGVPRVSLSLGAGTAGAGEAAAGVSGGSSRLALSAGATAAVADGVEAFNSRYARQAVSARAVWTPDGRTDVGLAVRGSASTYRYPTDGSGAAVDSNQAQRRRAAALSVDAGRRLTDRVEVRVLLGLHVQRDSVDDATDGPADTLGIWAYESGATTSRASADLRANVRAGRGAVLTVGASAEQQREVGHTSFRSAFGAGGGSTDVERTDRALYAQAVAERGAVGLQAGLRVDDSRTFGGHGTWRVGVSYRLAPATRLRAALGTAFKEPTFGEIHSTGYSIGNPALRPERARSWEAGLEQSLAAGRARLSATWFDQRFRDLIQYTFVTAGPADPNYYNVAAADARGLEVQLAVDPSRSLALRLTYDWLDTEAADSGFDGAVFAEGRRLLRRPAHAASLAAEWHGPRVRLGSRVMAVGSRDDLDFGTFPAVRVTLPGYARLDAWGRLALGQAGAGTTVALTLRVENAAGADIREIRGFRTPGRRVMAGASIGR